ncbi:hypothetical protein GGE35_002948 [Rhizobium cellulosilyticum]|uniref:Uncharacterized protein n=1 Tax=Aliirhizobium cellulosilyticum TaxID=393664 RepID=A0A7W6S8S2_9HYPH|nr:hypothetical protein [Rhizobium cellulosilyticum]MBB4412494.1 hypothetical protein [Rhizobium cellulosilyticum]MBB4447126.1 hypothetical protein [Rhizobium cellulosilyticum]
MKNQFAVADATEMFTVLRKTECLKRYQEISHQLLSELLVAIATEGEVVGGISIPEDKRVCLWLGVNHTALQKIVRLPELSRSRAS